MASLERVGGSSSFKGASERKSAVEDGRSDAPIAAVASAIEPLTSLKIEECVSGNGSGSLNETSSSGVEGLEGAESTGSVTGSG